MADLNQIHRAIASLGRPKPPAPKRPRTKTPGYREAIKWIARNDDCDCLGYENPGPSVTMSMVADLFDRPVEKVMEDVGNMCDELFGGND